MHALAGVSTWIIGEPESALLVTGPISVPLLFMVQRSVACRLNRKRITLPTGGAALSTLILLTYSLQPSTEYLRLVLPNSPRLCFCLRDMFLLSQCVEPHRLSSTSMIDFVLLA